MLHFSDVKFHESNESTMRTFEWNGAGVGINRFVECDVDTAKQVLGDIFTGRHIPSLDGRYYLLVDTSNRIVYPLPFLSFAFGGQYNDDSPIGKKVDNISDLNDYLVRAEVKFWLSSE